MAIRTATFQSLCFAALFALAACGSEGGSAGFKGISGTLATLSQPRPTASDLRATLTPEALAAEGRPLILAEIAARRAVALMFIAGQNAGHVTWMTADQISLTLQSGVLTATRGLGDDLMSSDVSQVIAALSGAATSSVRIHRYLDGAAQTELRSFACDYSRSGNETVDVVTRRISAAIITEDCISGTESFRNRYWISDAGQIVQSEQWIGPRAGWVRILHLGP